MFLADNIQDRRGRLALDVGSGSGYLTRLLAENFELVVGTDIDFDVLKSQTYRTENLVCCNGSDALMCGFDLIVCNMPYLATDEILDVATDGGKGGLDVPRKIIDSVHDNIRPGGIFVFVTSSLSEYGGLISHARKLGLECTIAAKKKLFFEELLLVSATRLSP